MSFFNAEISNILEYIGASFIVIRFIPIIKDYWKLDSLPYNPWLILLEWASNITLGVSGGLVGSIPMIIANGICFISIIAIVLHNKCKNKNKSNYYKKICDNTNNGVLSNSYGAII